MEIHIMKVIQGVFFMKQLEKLVGGGVKMS